MSGCRLVALLAVVAIPAGSAPAQQQENPIAARVKAAVKDPAKPFTLVIRLKVKEGAGAKLEAAFGKAAKATRKEKGNRAYDLNRDPQMPTQYLVYERWQDLPALEAHLKASYIMALLAELGELTAGPPEVSILVPTSD